MTKLVLLFIASAAVVTPAVAGTPISFQRDGITYVGDMTERNGVTHIDGRELASGRTFNLIVNKGRVSGTYDGMQVSYAAPRNDQLASR